MLYHSTRNKQITASPAEALLRGLAPDGGLFLPDSFEAAKIDLEKTLSMTSNEISAEILSKFFTDFSRFTPRGIPVSSAASPRPLLGAIGVVEKRDLVR